MVFTAKVGKGVLCLATDKNVHIGYFRAIMKKWAPQITIILQNYLEPEKVETNKELKELYNHHLI